MDCSICLDEITKQTGVVTLSCSHNFHFRCIDEWFYKQLCESQHQTCPCCRNEGNELDRCAFEEVEEEDDDEESYADSEASSVTASEASESDTLAEMLISGEFRLERNPQGQWLVTSTHDIAYESLRNVFGPLNTLDVEVETPQEVAARKIQAVFRGYRARSGTDVHKAAQTLLRLFLQAYSLD